MECTLATNFLTRRVSLPDTLYANQVKNWKGLSVSSHGVTKDRWTEDSLSVHSSCQTSRKITIPHPTDVRVGVSTLSGTVMAVYGVAGTTIYGQLRTLNTMKSSTCSSTMRGLETSITFLMNSLLIWWKTANSIKEPLTLLKPLHGNVLVSRSIVWPTTLDSTGQSIYLSKRTCSGLTNRRLMLWRVLKV